MSFFVTMWVYIIAVVAVVLSGCYLGLIIYYRNCFLKLKQFEPSPNLKPKTKFSVVIPARNEQENIRVCLTSIYQQIYPSHLFEVVVVDDHSTDDTSSVVEMLQKPFQSIKLIRLSDVIKGRQLNAYKKKAIDIAIAQTTGDWIITTDADCVVTENWLKNLDAYIQQTNSVLVAGPVKFINTGSFVSLFQCLDFLSLQGITAASVSAGMHSMCNGANLAYEKNAFRAVNGFRGIDNVASGDDMLLMHKIKRAFPSRIGYIFSPESIVATDAMPDWKSFFNQRIRWASKAESYDDKSIFWVLLIVYFYNVLLTALPVLAFFDIFYLKLLLVLGFFKTVAELSFMFPVAKFFGERRLLWWFTLMQPLHIVYTVTAGWLGKFGSYQWKGRKVK